MAFVLRDHMIKGSSNLVDEEIRVDDQMKGAAPFAWLGRGRWEIILDGCG